MEWIKFIKEDSDTYPEPSGNWDDCSKDVIIYYKTFNGIHKYAVGYTDWNDETVWYSRAEKGQLDVIAWSYFNKYKI